MPVAREPGTVTRGVTAAHTLFSFFSISLFIDDFAILDYFCPVNVNSAHLIHLMTFLCCMITNGEMSGL
jgi:hypothetical protein